MASYNIFSLDVDEGIEIIRDESSVTDSLNQAEAVNIPPKGSIKVVFPSLNNKKQQKKKKHKKHRQLTGKAKGKGLPITKTLVKGRKLMQDGYLKMNDMYTCSSSDYFKVKCKCLASMKNVLRDIVVTLEIHTGEVVKAYCSCPAGMSGYCNHVMAVLLKIASFSLEGTSNIPNDVACHSDYHFHRPSLNYNNTKTSFSLYIYKKCYA